MMLESTAFFVDLSRSTFRKMDYGLLSITPGMTFRHVFHHVGFFTVVCIQMTSLSMSDVQVEVSARGRHEPEVFQKGTSDRQHGDCFLVLVHPARLPANNVRYHEFIFAGTPDPIFITLSFLGRVHLARARACGSSRSLRRNQRPEGPARSHGFGCRNQAQYPHEMVVSMSTTGTTSPDISMMIV